ncbi:amino acid adenylation domain-containing protein, partial [Xenorhabdus sp. NBAII XenSa04]
MPMSCSRINNEKPLAFENSSVPSCQFSLSSTQQVVWLDQIIRPDNPCYNLGSVVLIEGKLDEALLMRAFETVVYRHDALRLRLINTQALPLQEIAETLPISVTIHDFSQHTDAEAQATQHIRAAFMQPFDLNGALWRAELLRVNDTRWYWQFCCHHLIGDATSLGLIPEDLAYIYGGLIRGEQLFEPASSYLDFVTEDNAYFDSQRYVQDRQFWLERYANLPPALLQPLNPEKTTSHGQTEPLLWQLDNGLFQRIEETVTRHGLSVLHFMYAILACYFARTRYFSHSTDAEEIVIGVPVHNRRNAKQKRTVGMFSSVIPVGITITPHDTFLDVMHKAAAELRRCYKRQRLPIAEINRYTQIQQKTGRAQLFDIILSFELFEANANMPGTTISGTTISDTNSSDTNSGTIFQYAAIQRGTPFPLFIMLRRYAFAGCEDANQPVTVEFNFSTNYLNRADVIALQSRIAVLTEAALTSTETLIQNLPILSLTEQNQLLVNFNTTQVNFPQDTLIHQLVETQVAHHPDATAVIFEDQALSYDELNHRANRLAHYLIALGVRPDDKVAICVERSLEMVVGLLAILKAGGAYVPLDPAYPTERLRYMLEDATPVALLTQTALADMLSSVMPGTSVHQIILDPQIPFLEEQPTHNPDTQSLGLTSHNLAYVIYTSGSTGLPKGVEMSLAALFNLLQWHRQNFSHLFGSDKTAPGRTLQFAAPGFDVAFQEIFTTLCEGGCLVLMNEEMRREPQQFLRLIQQKQINRIFLPYIALQHLAEAANHIEGDFSCLAHIITAGEQLRITPAIRHFIQRTGSCQLHNHYGPTESHVVTAYTLDQDVEQWSTFPPIGRPIANIQIYILDPYGQPVPIGVTGEIHIAGTSVARGYLNRPELTAERFLINPFSSKPDARMYKTGDLGRWLPDGNIEYLGRNDFQVKLRGFRIELGEIETQLAQCHGIREAVVLLREDEPDHKRLVAYLRPLDGAKPTPAELRQQLAQHLADYMLPSAFVTLDAFPVTPNGKLDRRALPVPDASAVVTRRYEAPMGEIETRLAQIWQDLLGLERVGRHDHFFELGGHSLFAVQLAARVRQVLGRELSLQQLFAQPLLADLAQTLTSALVTTQIVIPAIDDRSRPFPLSFAQQRLWFLSQLDPAASLAYHIPVLLRLTGQLNQQALIVAFERLIVRHESLRTRFILIEGQPYQYINNPADSSVALSYQDLRSLTPDAHTQHIADLTAIEAQTPFDFSQSPLLRVQLLQLTDQTHMLLLTLHHIIADGWSIGVLEHELDVLYHVALNGQGDPLPPLTIQYADYAVWQRDCLQATTLPEQRDFWQKQLAGAPALLSLPTDRPRPPVQTYTGSQVPFHLDATLLASLKAVGQRHHTTLFMTILAAWSIVLARLSGQDDIVIGTPVANRPHSELEGLIGFFVNTLALRITLDDSASVTDLLTQVRERALAAYAHQDLPFEQVVEALQPERSLSYSPIFQVMLALDNTPARNQTSSGLQIARIEQTSHSAHFDLMLLLIETDAGLTGGLEYAADLFDCATVERMVGYLTHILTAMVADETQRIATLPMLPETERQQLLVEFNATKADFPQDALIHQLVETQVTRTPDATAVVCGDQSLSYDELNYRANRLAHHLIAQGIQPDDRVAICVERNLNMVVGLLAILKAGGAYVPLDPAYPSERLAYMLEDAKPIALLTQTTLVEKLNTPVPTVILDDQEAFLTSQPTHNLDVHALGLTSRHLAYVIYTSGSTGQPKGVAITHCNTINFLTWAQRTFGREELSHTLFATSLNFDLAVYECFAPLISGGTVHLVSDVLSLVTTEHPISLINTVPSAISHLLEVNAVPMTTQTVNLAGEALKPHVVEHLFARSSVQNVCNLYGPSETTTYSTWTRMSRTAGFVSHIGRPIANTQIYILDRHGQPVPLGVTGEIHIAGAGVARGYLNLPELTAERFLADPFSPVSDARMYKTGDLGRWLPDGHIEYLGRNDFQIKLRGFRIEPGEIEAKLMQCHGVREAVVLAREYISDEENISHENLTGEKRLVAYVRPLEGIELSPANLRQQLARQLAEYMLPSAFVILETFPLTPNGKLDHQALPEPDVSAVVARGYEIPVGEIEITLAEIWQELLGVEQVGRHDHFFELGGHSLMIVSLIERLYDLGWQLDVRSIFSTPILNEMAQAIQGDTETFAVPPNCIPAHSTHITPDMLPLVALSQTEIDAIIEATPGGVSNVQDIYPLAPLQEGILFHYLLQEQGDTYLLLSLLAFDNRERLDTFLVALQQVIDRHDILRTAAYWQGLEKPVQVVWRKAPLHVNSFTPATAEDVPTQLLAHTDQRCNRLDLSRAPLFATDIAYDPAQEEWLLALRFHHLVCDHMTLALIFAEITQIQQGHAEALPAALPYRNFIAQTLSVPATVHEAYFRTQLADIDTPTAPFGVLSMQNDNEPIIEAQLLLEPTLAEAIRTQARSLGVSPGVLFHAAWAQVLAQISGCDDVVFGSVLLGRLSGGVGTARTLGMFINTLPVRISLTDRSVQEVIQAAYHSLTTLLEHEQAPLVLAQRCSGVTLPMPLFSTLLNYRHSQANGSDMIGPHQTGIRLVTIGERTNYPVTLSVDDLGTNFRLTAQTVTSIDPARVTHYLATTISGLVEALHCNPQQLIRDVPVLPPTERQQLLVDFNATQTVFPQNALIHQLFEAQAAHHPDAIAVMFEEQTISYGELNLRANRLAHYLIELGVRPDDRVAICVERSPEMVVGLLAILKAGGAYVPLDPTYPTGRLTSML